MKDSFLVLSHLHEDREKAKAELISNYDINEVYQRYWDRVVSLLP